MSFTDKEIKRFVKDQKEYMLSKPSEAHAIVGYDEWFVEWLKQHDQRLIEEIEREVKNVEGVDGSELIVRDKILFKLAEYKV